MRRPGWYDAVIWLVFTSMGFLLPMLGGTIVLMASGVGLSLESITAGGQFAVSSAGLLMTTSYFLARPGSIARLPMTEWFMIASFMGLFSGVILLVLATLASSGFDIDSRYYQWPSVILFALALLVAFIAVRLDRDRVVAVPEFLESNKRVAHEKIEKDFDDTF